jgi:hypothetical protein
MWYQASGIDALPPPSALSRSQASKNQVTLARRAESINVFSHGSSSLIGLPNELQMRILRLVLLQPDKVRVIAKVEDGGMEPYDFTEAEEYIGKQWASTYKFFMAVKVPRFLISPSEPGPIDTRGYCWHLDEPATLLAICAVNKHLREWGREIFYRENYFEVLDDSMDDRIEHVTPSKPCAGDQLAHRWLDLISQTLTRDGSRLFVEPLLKLTQHLNIDLPPYCDEHQAQTEWHFERIANAIVSMPNLKKLVINVRMSFLGSVWYLKDLRPSYQRYIRPSLWPGFRKLPWGKSKPRVFVPEQRKAQAWLRKLIDEEYNHSRPNSQRAWIGLPTNVRQP